MSLCVHVVTALNSFLDLYVSAHPLEGTRERTSASTSVFHLLLIVSFPYLGRAPSKA